LIKDLAATSNKQGTSQIPTSQWHIQLLIPNLLLVL